MKNISLAVIILAAGQGTRMKSALPKVLHPIAGRPMLGHVLAVAKELGAQSSVAVIAPGADAVARLVKDWDAASVVQTRQLGTGHAVLAAEKALENFDGTVLILFGDTPLLTAATLSRLVARVDADTDNAADVAALGFHAADPTGYGRMIVEKGALARIVEHKDASAAERAVDLCFAGMLAAKARTLFGLLHGVGNENAQGEFYLTDIIAIAAKQGLAVAAVEGDEAEMLGVNSRAQLADAEALFQARKRRALMEAGVGFAAPETVYLSADTEIAPDTMIGPYVVFGPGVRITGPADIRAFCHIEGAEIAGGAVIGPFARLRPGAELAEGVHIGNFVEVKNASLGKGAKANHLTYLGDARVGAGTNVGAGTITCNYDGHNKYHTEIGAGVFVGTHATLVAPVAIGDGAYVAAGSVITENVEAEALALGRARQTAKPGRAGVLRARNKAVKDKVKSKDS